MPFFTLFLFVVAIFAIIFCLKSIKIVQQAEVMIIERLGKFDRVLESGFQFIIPLIDMPRSINWKQTQTLPDGRSYSFYSSKDRIDLRESVYDFPRQNVITKDNVSIGINALFTSKSLIRKVQFMKFKTYPKQSKNLLKQH